MKTKTVCFLLIISLYTSLFSEDLYFNGIPIKHSLYSGHNVASKNTRYSIIFYNKEFAFLKNNVSNTTTKLQILGKNYYFASLIPRNGEQIIVSYGSPSVKDWHYLTAFNLNTGEQIWSNCIDNDFYIHHILEYKDLYLTGFRNEGSIIKINNQGLIIKKTKLFQHLLWIGKISEGTYLAFGTQDYKNEIYELLYCNMDDRIITTYTNFNERSNFSTNKNKPLFLSYTKNDENNNELSVNNCLTQEKIIITNRQPITTATFSSDGKYIFVVTGHLDFMLTIYDLNGHILDKYHVPALKKYHRPNEIVFTTNEICILQENNGP